MQLEKVTLEQMLFAREMRAQSITSLSSEWGLPVVCATMNMAGEYKVTPLSRVAFLSYTKKIRVAFPLRYETVALEYTGDTLLACCAYSAGDIKRIAQELEDENEVGRLFDIDVIGVGGEKLSRISPRRCLICNAPAHECARSRRHGTDAVVSAAKGVFIRYVAERLGDLAHCALISEVNTTPKPGLVDKNNSGSHSDMTIDDFYASADAITPYFRDMAQFTLENSDMQPQKLMESLINIGKAAERAMYEKTAGANTHMGAIYTLGLLTAGAAMAFSHSLACHSDDVFSYAYALASSAFSQEKTAISGARSEAASEFSMTKYAISQLEQHSSSEISANDAQAFTLIDIMSRLRDTNILRRGGEEALSFVKARCAEIADMSDANRINAIYELDDEMQRRNLSGGGSADVLACAIFMRLVTEEFSLYSDN